jgi:hypothetical protein
MIHVEEIRKLVSAGQLQEAEQHVDSLLLIGPKNTQALKLKAQLLQLEGRFEEQAKIWQQIANIDPEDFDTIMYFQKKFVDEREHFYFTEDSLGGGRRFLAVPRSTIKKGFIGMIGCVLFLMMPRLAMEFPQYIGDREVFMVFGLFVVVPWISLLYTYALSLRWVEVSTEEIRLIGRFRNIRLAWGDLKSITVCHSLEYPDYLGVILTPAQEKSKSLFLNLSDNDSAVKAKSYFIAELRKHYSDVHFKAYEHLQNIPKRLISF